MTKVGIIGATGMAGSAIFKAASAAGLDVTAIVRNKDKAIRELGENSQLLVKDAFSLTKADLTAFDVVVNAFATAPEKAYLHTDLAAKLIALLRESNQPRLIFILGAGSLYTGDDHHLAVEDIRKLPGSEAWVAVPENQLRELRFLQEVDNVNWVGISPGLNFVAGKKAEKILSGKDEVLFDADGKSETTSDTMAAVIVDESNSQNISMNALQWLTDKKDGSPHS